MNLLFLTERFPYPPTNGGMLRVHHFLTGISKSHHIDLLCFSEDSPNEYLYENLRVHAVRPRGFNRLDRAIALWRSIPVYPLANVTRAMFAQIERVSRSKRIDICHIDTLGMATYVDESPAPVVIDFMDCISVNYKRLAAIQANPLRRRLYEFEAWKTARFERAAAGSASAIISCTSTDSALLEASTGKPVSTIRNGVEVAVRRESIHRPPSVVFVGFLDYSANLDAVRFFTSEIFPLIRKTVPGVTFEVVGKGSQPVSGMPGVRFRGYVENLAEVYANASVVVAPLRAGTGIKNKVLEALAHGVPLVATQIAAEGVDLVDGTHCLIADDPTTFAAHVMTLLQDPNQNRLIGLSGQAHVNEHFSWERAVGELLHVYETTLARPAERIGDRRGELLA